MTLTDPKTEYAPCPWCGKPGRLMSRVAYISSPNFVTYFKYAVGCRSKLCPVKPRTGWISELAYDNKEKAIEIVVKEWEKRNE